MSPSCASSGLMPSDSKEPACSFICSLSTTPAETRDEEHNLLSDNHMPSKAVTQCCSHIILTVGDVPKVMLIKSSSQESVHELVISESESRCLLWLVSLFTLNMSCIFFYD